MRIKRRALWGYTPASVQEAVNAIENRYNKIREEIEAEMNDLTRKNEQLTIEIKRLEADAAE